MEDPILRVKSNSHRDGDQEPKATGSCYRQHITYKQKIAMTIYTTIDPITSPPFIYIAPEEEQALERGRNQRRPEEHAPDKDSTPSGSQSRRSFIVNFVHRLRSPSQSKSHSRASSPSLTQDDKEPKYSHRKSNDIQGDYANVYLENLREEQEEGASKDGDGLPPPPANKKTRKPWSMSSST